MKESHGIIKRDVKIVPEYLAHLKRSESARFVKIKINSKRAVFKLVLKCLSIIHLALTLVLNIP